MAITTSHPTITTAVKVGGAPLEEDKHAAEPEDDTITTRYIQATTGETFEIHVDIAAGTEFAGDCLAFYISVDGKMADPAITFRSGERHAGSQVVSKGVYTAGNMVKKYRFAALEKREGDAVPNKEQVEAAMELGTIRIEVHDQIIKNIVNGHLDLSTGRKEVDAVDEKALKGQAISSTTSYTEAVANDDLHARYWDADFVDPGMKPMAVFVFKYTTREDLQAMDLIPRDPTPAEEEAQAEPEPDYENMSREELIADNQRRRQAEKDAAVQIKRERGEDEQRRSKQDKRFRTTITLGDHGNEEELVTTLIPVQVETIY